MIQLWVYHLGNLLAPCCHDDGAPRSTAAQGSRNAVPVAGIVIPNIVENDQAPLPCKMLNNELMKRAQLVAIGARSGDRFDDLARHADDVELLGDPDPERHVEV
jgi:hypothetical protein